MVFSERMWLAEVRGISSGPSLGSSRMQDSKAGLVRYQNMSGRAAAACTDLDLSDFTKTALKRVR